MCDPISLAITAGVGALTGGVISKARGGSFTKGALMGVGGNLIGIKNTERDKKAGVYRKPETAAAPKKIQMPTLADASARVKSDTRRTVAGLGMQSVSTTPRGLGTSGFIQKKKLLGQ